MQIAVLEQTLRDRPDDAVVWRAYGDWLRERDDARGELISLEQRRARSRGRVGLSRGVPVEQDLEPPHDLVTPPARVRCDP